MTKTGQWLKQRGTELGRRLVSAGVLRTVGLILMLLGLGVLLGRLGVYKVAPVLVITAWLGVVGAIVWGVYWVKHRSGWYQPVALAREVEMHQDMRHGSLGGLAEWTPQAGSADLGRLADRQAEGYLQLHGRQGLSRVRKHTGRSLRNAGLAFFGGALAFVAAGPTSSGSAEFWNPIATVIGVNAPLRLEVDPPQVRRGDSILVSVLAPGRLRATLWSRAPGEPWASQSLSLDSAGRASVVLGPLHSDRFLLASSGGRTSDTLHVHVLFPAFLADLQLIARFSTYLERPDEPLTPSSEPIRIPVGTRILTSGQVTVPVDSVYWENPYRRVSLAHDHQQFSGSFGVTRSALWKLRVKIAGGGQLEDEPPELNVLAVPDSAPIVQVPIPGADTAAPFTLLQPLVVDARDDHAITSVQLVSWRVSRLGVVSDERTESIPLSELDTEQAVLQWVLDLNGRGFLPGDTAYYKVRALDNAPTPNVGESREFVLWLPSISELREAMRRRSQNVGESADSLTNEQRDLARRLEELAAERERSPGELGERGQRGAARGPDDLPFKSVERARELVEKQASAIERAQQLEEEVRELAESAWSAGITDLEFQEQLRDLQELLEQAITDELRERLQALREAVEELDPESVRDALQQLSESAEQLRRELERGRELFERAAIEGEMSALADDARDLAAEQREWNNEVTGETSEEALAAQENMMAERADSLSSRLEQLGESLEEGNRPAESVQNAAQQANQAAQAMKQAASQAQQGNRQQAQQQGEQASQALDPLSQQLEQQRDQLRESWREEVLEAMDRALVETARIAEQQQQVMERLNRGESGADVRGAQAAARAGVDQIIQRLQDAAGKNALVSPQLGAALGMSQQRMSEALDQLARANPNPRQAGEMAGEALDGLNAVAHQLLRSRAQVSGAQSGSGLGEAMEQLAEMAQQQGQLNSSTSAMLSLTPAGRQQLMQQLQQLAQQQRSLADQLERMQAEDQISGAQQLAEEAREIARELEAGRLDRETIERQERLFRRLLDAGRTLRSDDEDDEPERVSQAADPDNVALPPAERTGAAGGPRYRYPTWSELRSLSPEERRLILDYFRRLNNARP